MRRRRLRLPSLLRSLQPKHAGLLPCRLQLLPFLFGALLQHQRHRSWQLLTIPLLLQALQKAHPTPPCALLQDPRRRWKQRCLLHPSRLPAAQQPQQHQLLPDQIAPVSIARPLSSCSLEELHSLPMQPPTQPLKMQLRPATLQVRQQSPRVLL